MDVHCCHITLHSYHGTDTAIYHRTETSMKLSNARQIDDAVVADQARLVAFVLLIILVALHLLNRSLEAKIKAETPQPPWIQHLNQQP